ncbi:hypothetical protein K503DRAFT_853242 [Rhizopogon vinicolor AM-OR11-026]|uniref:Prolyl 4-hydroxylase alpha subunit domain-containing protein n=1 Tax=Rhizopogon vinicolor AM-OR11-026 TaxID=1314800 RepID=A0A1B7NFD2_9AGAM|nr:hypothetical protein K503DRAFT_853242 [Rhizopogon vinicolor AM-OR11-026]
MPKKSKVSNNTSQSSKSASAVSSDLTFPDISQKEGLECRVLLEDQIILIDEFLSVEECKRLVQFINNVPLELTPPKKKGEAERVNFRFSVTSVSFAQRLHSLLLPHLPSFPPPTTARRRLHPGEKRAPHSCNSNIRMYKYTPSQYFGPHYDDSVRDPETGAKSEWTVLVYLTGIEDGVKGGETLFYKDERGKPRETLVAPLTRGTVLLHRHGNECLLHEGSLVRDGTKYILRSDLMFM